MEAKDLIAFFVLWMYVGLAPVVVGVSFIAFSQQSWILGAISFWFWLTYIGMGIVGRKMWQEMQ